MKVLLRKTHTCEYYAGDNRWTAEARDARDYDQVDRAIQVRREEELAGVEVILRFDDPFCDLVLPPGAPG